MESDSSQNRDRNPDSRIRDGSVHEDLRDSNVVGIASDVPADSNPTARFPGLLTVNASDAGLVEARYKLSTPDTKQAYALDPKTTTTQQIPDSESRSTTRRQRDDNDDDGGPVRVIRIGDDETRRMYTSNMVNTSKYTAWNFIPKCLFEQFARVANVYFLIISIVQVTTRLSPTSQFATLIPLTCVMSVSLVKEFVEDWIRHEADDGVNFSEVDVVKFGGSDGVYTRRAFSSDVRVGDVLQIHDGQSIPADSLLLSTCISSGIGFIETSNLDVLYRPRPQSLLMMASQGENNLKFRQSISCTANIDSARIASKLRGTVSCDEPNANLYRFRGAILVDGQSKSHAINHNNLVLRGAALRSTETAYVLVIYTGPDCKQSLNAVPSRSKLSNVERLVNQIIIFILGAIAFSCACMALAFMSWSESNRNAWYLPFVATTSIQDQLDSLVTFLILFNNLVPISLYLTLEVVKFTQAKLIENDLRMYHSATKSRAFARTSALNEDLGQIAYVFSDKTGDMKRSGRALAE